MLLCLAQGWPCVNASAVYKREESSSSDVRACFLETHCVLSARTANVVTTGRACSTLKISFKMFLLSVTG